MARVLIVDDYPGIRETFAGAFRDHGHEAVCAENGKEGLERIAGVQLVVLDYNMPVMDGFAFSRALRTDRRYAPWKDVPIIGIGDFPKVKREHLTECVDKLGFWSEYGRIVKQYLER